MKMSDIIRKANTPPLPRSHTNEELYHKQTVLLSTFLTHGAISPAQYSLSLWNITREMNLQKS